MTFHDVRLPEEIEQGSIGGPRFKTTVLSLQSGFEKLNRDWLDTRGSWDLAYGVLKVQDDGISDLVIEDLQNFFYARAGRAHSFRFKDWMDYQIGRDVATGQFIGLGDGATVAFQFFKRYSSGGIDHDRVAQKLVSGTISIWDEGSLQADPGDYTVNLNTGLITFAVAPLSTGGSGAGGAHIISGKTEFDNHVRFDTDALDLNMFWADAASVPGIPIIEKREVS